MLPIIVTAAVIRRENCVLITKRLETSRHGGLWEFPGGKLDPNESPQEGLRRELQEELGIDSDVGDIFEAVYYRYPQGTVLILVYECHQRNGTIRNLEVADHRWVPINELEQFNLLPADAPIVAKLVRDSFSPPHS
ncbi:MAG: DNA mismatch repair protein MutT [Desulfuromonadaceae bacterium GWC2_58_13]|nr:MAG: DNA mismatch repair protein MutT [Desulfuromonadaceae bacterium GWC2_58_13]